MSLNARAGGAAGRASLAGSPTTHRRRRLGPQAGSASAPRGPGSGDAGGLAADPAVGGGAASLPGPAPPGKGRRRVTAGGSPKGTARGELLSVLVSYFDI